MNRFRPLLVAAALSAAAAAPALASGSYNSRPPAPRSAAIKVPKADRDRFALGQSAFNGRAMAVNPSAMEAQTPRLAALQAKLPETVAKKKDLSALAGKLSDEQLAALEYYVAERYGMKR